MFLALADRQAERATNFGEMIERLGIDPSAAPVATTIGASARACSWCRHSAACRAWLDGRVGAISQAPEFCPNRQRFAVAKAAGMSPVKRTDHGPC